MLTVFAISLADTLKDLCCTWDGMNRLKKILAFTTGA
jgi:hypothetical protein